MDLNYHEQGTHEESSDKIRQALPAVLDILGIPSGAAHWIRLPEADGREDRAPTGACARGPDPGACLCGQAVPAASRKGAAEEKGPCTWRRPWERCAALMLSFREEMIPGFAWTNGRLRFRSTERSRSCLRFMPAKFVYQLCCLYRTANEWAFRL